MAISFTKLFSSLTDSTIWCESDRTRIVWITMLAMADRLGRVHAAVPGLARRANVPTEDCRIALDLFMKPDKDSRTPDNDGRRIAEIDGGWQLLNYAKYRELQDVESQRESKRKWAEKNRAEKKSDQHIHIHAKTVEVKEKK